MSKEEEIKQLKAELFDLIRERTKVTESLKKLSQIIDEKIEQVDKLQFQGPKEMPN